MSATKDVSRFTESIAKHDAFLFIEYPMRMAMISAEIAIARANIELDRAKHLAEDAQWTADFYRKLYNL